MNIIKISRKKQINFIIYAIIMLILSVICFILGKNWNFINYFLGAFLLIAAIAYIVIAIGVNNRISKSLKRYSPSEIDDMNQEIQNQPKHFKKQNIFFTEHLIIDYSTGIDMFHYNEILWMFPYIVRHNTKEKEWYVSFVTLDKRTHTIVNIEKFDKVSENEYIDMMKYVHDLNQNILVGYTDENIKIMKEKYNYEFKKDKRFN